MKHWQQLASALELGIPENELSRVIGPLETLEAAFRPLAKEIPPETEPAFMVLLDRKEEAE